MTSTAARPLLTVIPAQRTEPVGDPMLEQYARQLRRELELVERKLRGEAIDSGPPESHMG
jgi:hypothetical protein